MATEITSKPASYSLKDLFLWMLDINMEFRLQMKTENGEWDDISELLIASLVWEEKGGSF